MKRTILILILNLFIYLSNAQTWYWATGANGVGGDDGMAIACDKVNSIYVTGHFTSNPLIIAGTNTLAVTGPTVPNTYVIKYDYNGNFSWAKSFGPLSGGQGIATYGTGNIYVGGDFLDTICTFGSYTLTNKGTRNFYLVKMDAAGNVLWARAANNYSVMAQVTSVNTDISGNVCVCGYFQRDTLTIGTTTLVNTTSNSYESDIFVAKYDPNGNLLWAKKYGGNLSEEANSIKTDASGNIYITGGFYSSNLPFGTVILTNFNSTRKDVYVTKLDPNGNVIWARSAGGSDQDEAMALSLDQSGNVYTTGSYASPTIIFGANTLNNNTSWGTNVFLVKYDNNGIVLWAKTFGGPGASGVGEIGMAVCTHSNYVFVSGSFYSPMMVIGTQTYSAPPGAVDPMFIVKYDNNGNVICSDVERTGGDDVAALDADQFGKVYIHGDVASPNLVLGTYTLTNNGNENLFTAKFDCTSTGIAEQHSEVLHKLFPNPFTNSFTIELNDNIPYAEILVYDMIGKRLLIETIRNGKFIVNMSSFSEGMYYYSIVSEGQIIENGKLIKE